MKPLLETIGPLSGEGAQPPQKDRWSPPKEVLEPNGFQGCFFAFFLSCGPWSGFRATLGILAKPVLGLAAPRNHLFGLHRWSYFRQSGIIMYCQG